MIFAGSVFKLSCKLVQIGFNHTGKLSLDDTSRIKSLLKCEVIFSGDNTYKEKKTVTTRRREITKINTERKRVKREKESVIVCIFVLRNQEV